MDSKNMGLLIGGILPALLLGICSIFQKLGTTAGISTGPFLIGAGLMITLVGAGFVVLERSAVFNNTSLMYACLYGILWALATGSIGIALSRYNGQISQLVPLFNMNTLVAVLIGLFLLAEWRTVNVPRIVIAALLIIAGGVLASRA